MRLFESTHFDRHERVVFVHDEAAGLDVVIEGITTAAAVGALTGRCHA